MTALVDVEVRRAKSKQEREDPKVETSEEIYEMNVPKNCKK